MTHELTRDYDNWKLTDWREGFERDMPRTLNDYHIDQYIIVELEVEQIVPYLTGIKKNYPECYGFDNLEVAEYNIIDQENIGYGTIFTVEIVWTNVEEVIVEDDEELKEIIEKEVETMWEDDKTTEVNYEIDVTEEYWG